MKKIVRLIKIISTICIVIGLIALIVIEAFVLINKKQTHYWEFKYESNDIKEIKIVEATGVLNFSTVKEIDIKHADELYSDIATLEMVRYGTNLAHPYDLCFLIVFENGEYDIISKKESKHYKYNHGKSKHYDCDELVAHNSWLECRDKDKFDELINKYLD